MIGKTISHYRILEKIGGGGMGVVYKAEDTKLKRTVALKFLPQDLTRNPVSKQRFIKEAQTASALDHPNISNIHEIDETEDGQLFISMTYYEGETLQKRIERGPIQVDQAVTITIQVAQGLLKAHSKGIIHRDIKPGNIFITEDGQAKILDFGLAKLAGETRITKEGTTAGTVAYMSPEQAQGKDVDETTDIWSLGVVLYEMLTGNLPFKGENWRVTLYSILNAQPESVKKLRADIPEALENTLGLMIKKDAKQRYQDTTTLITDLCTIARESGFVLPHSVIQKEKTKFHYKKLIVPTLVVALVAAIILFTRISLIPTAPIPERNNIAVMAFKNLSGEEDLEYLSVAIPNLLITSLQETGQVDVLTWERMHDLARAAGKKVELIDEETVFEICRNQGIDNIVLGSFTRAGDVFATDAKVLDVKTKKILKSTTSKGESVASILNNQIDELSYSIALSIGIPKDSKLAAQTRVSDVTTSSMEAYAHFIKGREYFDRSYSNDARRHFEAAIQLDSTFATAYLYLAWTTDGSESEEALKKAKELSGKATERESLYIEASYAYLISYSWDKYLRTLNLLAEMYPTEKRAYCDLGYFYHRHGLPDVAIEAYGKCLKLDPDFGEGLTGLSYTYLYMGAFNKALEIFKRYQSLYPNDANTFDTMADIYFHMGNFEEAIVSYKKALEIKPDFVISAWKLAYVHALKEEYDEALQWCDYYITNAPSPASQATGHSIKAFMHYWLGNVTQWNYNFQKLTDLYKSIGERWRLSAMDRVAAALHYQLADLERSRYHIQRHLDSISVIDPSQSPWRIAYCNHCFGLVDLEEGDFESARARLKVIESLIPMITRTAHWIKFRQDLLYAELLLQQDSLEKAIETCRNMSSMGPPDLMLQNIMVNNTFMNTDVLARAYVQQGKIDNAIKEYENLLTPDPKHGKWLLINPKYHYRLAKLYEKKGRYKQAIAQYEKYINILKESDAYLAEVNAARMKLAALKK